MNKASSPAPDVPAPLQAILRQAEHINGMLHLADGLIQARRAVDLAGLEGHIGLLCAGALDLPAEQRREARARLVLLVIELDKLAQSLEQP